MLSPAIICYFDFKINVENNLYEMIGKVLKMYEISLLGINDISPLPWKNLPCAFLIKSRYLCHHIQNLNLHMLKKTPYYNSFYYYYYNFTTNNNLNLLCVVSKSDMIKSLRTINTYEIFFIWNCYLCRDFSCIPLWSAK